MRVYLDNCCYNRPYDNQLQIRVSLEAQAKLYIQKLIRKGTISLVTSYMLDYENSKNPYELKRILIANFIAKNASAHVDASKYSILAADAEKIIETGIKPKDAIHLACAIHEECDYFITTDKRILKFKSERIKTINPVDFVVLLEGEQYD